LSASRSSEKLNSQLELPLQFAGTQVVGRAHLALDGTLVSYTIKRSARRRAISILVDEDGVRVGAPWHATQSAIERLLRTHAGWVLRKLEEWNLRRGAPRRWSDGEVLMFLGEPLTLRIVEPVAARSLHVQDGDLVVPMSKSGPRTIAASVQDWLRAEALERFCERVEHYRMIVGISACPEVRLSGARTRWGSCHVSGRILLNWRLVQMPSRLIDYVVAHEVAHLIEMNHSQRFWRTVARMVPDHATRRGELRREGHRYLLV
jgi:predicted metal-dependent hydrolase